MATATPAKRKSSTSAPTWRPERRQCRITGARAIISLVRHPHGIDSTKAGELFPELVAARKQVAEGETHRKFKSAATEVVASRRALTKAEQAIRTAHKRVADSVGDADAMHAAKCSVESAKSERSTAADVLGTLIEARDRLHRELKDECEAAAATARAAVAQRASDNRARLLAEIGELVGDRLDRLALAEQSLDRSSRVQLPGLSELLSLPPDECEPSTEEPLMRYTKIDPPAASDPPAPPKADTSPMATYRPFTPAKANAQAVGARR